MSVYTYQGAGLAEASEEPEGARRLEFVRPLVGFGQFSEFEICSLGEEFAPYARLCATGSVGLDFLVVPPGALFSDYVFEVPDELVDALGISEVGEVEVLVLVTGKGAPIPTVNLRGPIVVNRSNGRAAQLVLSDDRYAVAVPIDAGYAQVRDRALA